MCHGAPAPGLAPPDPWGPTQGTWLPYDPGARDGPGTTGYGYTHIFPHSYNPQKIHHADAPCMDVRVTAPVFVPRYVPLRAPLSTSPANDQTNKIAFANLVNSGKRQSCAETNIRCVGLIDKKSCVGSLDFQVLGRREIGGAE